MTARILIMDDQPQDIEPLRRYLSDDGYHVSVVDSAVQAKRDILEGHADLVMLDVDMLPRGEIERLKTRLKEVGREQYVAEEGQGFEVAAWTRSHATNVGVIILTRRDSVQDRIGGLDRGADDFIAKGEPLPEVAARIRAVLRRRIPLPKDTAHFAGSELNLKSQRLKLRTGETVQLTESEFRLLRTLLECPHKVVSREELYMAVNGSRMPTESDRAIDTLVSKLRRKMGVTREDMSIITTVHGKGYCLDSDVDYSS